MWMNVYVRFNECNCCNRYDELHITKFSMWRKPLFQAYRRLPSWLEKRTWLSSIISIAHWKSVIKYGKIFTEYWEELKSKAFWKKVKERKWESNRELESHRDQWYSFTFIEFS